jgi:hypothetical protein
MLYSNVLRSLSDSKKELVQQRLYTSSKDEESEKAGKEVDAAKRLKWPVYLNRNKRVMKQARKHPEMTGSAKEGELLFENGLIARQLPRIRKVQFEPNTTDVLVYKRKSQLNVEDEFLQSYKTTLRFKQVLEAQRLK